jgi:hypothetical protein
MATAIWRRQDDEWQPLLPSAFPSEATLHDLVEETPAMLPLSGDPTLTVLGREVRLGANSADLIAVESDGRLVVVEIKLGRNAEARRAVVAQVLTYAAHLSDMTARDLDDTLRSHLATRGHPSVAGAARATDQSGEFDEQDFLAGLEESLRGGSFRLVLVLDEAPSELVRLVGYLESIAPTVAIDLITVSAYDVGGEQIMVPQRVDPDHSEDVGARPAAGGARTAAKARGNSVDGSDGFEQAIERSDASQQPLLRRLLDWARGLEADGLATLRTYFGDDRDVLLVWIRGEKAGLVSIWRDRVPALSLWRTVFVRRAWDHVATIEAVTGRPIGQGTTVTDLPDELLDALTAAYRDAARAAPTWNGRDFYVTFGENEQRRWDEAVAFGFISAGGGEWYSSRLRQLEPGHRVFAYIPRGNGVGGYVGVGHVTGTARPAKDFVVEVGGQERPYLDVTSAPEAGQHRDDEKLAEFVVPVEWIATRTRDAAIQDSDLFANQNPAVKLTHGYTLDRLREAFALDD